MAKEKKSKDLETCLLNAFETRDNALLEFCGLQLALLVRQGDKVSELTLKAIQKAEILHERRLKRWIARTFFLSTLVSFLLFFLFYRAINWPLWLSALLSLAFLLIDFAAQRRVLYQRFIRSSARYYKKEIPAEILAKFNAVEGRKA